jgi:exonuclease VII large subunit
LILLEKGYSITRYKNNIIKDFENLKEGSEIETITSNGTIKSIIKNFKIAFIYILYLI